MNAAEKLIREAGLSGGKAAVLHNPSNMFYITEGYTGEGLVYVSAARSVIVTDFRYTEQAERQAPGFSVVMTEGGKGHNDWVKEFCDADGITEVLFEDDCLTVRQFEAFKDKVGTDRTFASLNRVPEKLREVKTDREVACIRRACEITGLAFSELLPKIHEGMTEKELQVELDFTMLRLGADGLAFDTIVASGENGSLCHAIPGPRKVKKGDMITFDFGAKFGGYCADMTRTVALGQPSDTMLKVYNTVLEAQLMSLAALKPGVTGIEVDGIARRHIDDAGYAGRFGHGLGHSVGIDIHENPNLNIRGTQKMEPGVVITVEPGIYLPGVGGVRIEDTCLVTENGCERLTTVPKELVIL